MVESLNVHYNQILRAITTGRVVPFLGAGVNLCDRPTGHQWQHGQTDYLPAGGELADYLAGSFGYPPTEPKDLARVSQHAAVMSGTGPLYDELREVFDADYSTTHLHRFLATLPATLRDKDHPHPYQLIVTTNYDDLLERAFQEANEPFDLVTYLAESL